MGELGPPPPPSGLLMAGGGGGHKLAPSAAGLTPLSCSAHSSESAGHTEQPSLVLHGIFK